MLERRCFRAMHAVSCGYLVYYEDFINLMPLIMLVIL